MLFFSGKGRAQTVFATETFGSGSAAGTLASGFAGDLGTWTTASTGTNGTDANEWYISGEECGNAVGDCGTACSGGDNSLHVSAIGGLCASPDCGAAYDESTSANETNKRAISPIIDCTGLAGIVLNFNYIAAQADDGFVVEYSVDGGTIWTTFTGGSVAASSCCDCDVPALCSSFGLCCGGTVACTGGQQGLWTSATLSFPATADDNSTVQFAFNWSNNGDGFGTDPSVAIDDITLTNATVLAIDLTQFEGHSRDNINTLEWSTLSELNSDYFDIEHSINGENFLSIGKITSHHNSSEQNNYFFSHETESEINYYRLKNVDFDGKFSFTRTIVIENELNGILLSHSETGYSVIGLKDTDGEINLYDLSGKVVSPPVQFQKEEHEVPLKVNDLSSGIYVVVIYSSEGTKKFKIIL